MSGNVDLKPAFQAEKVTGKFFRMVIHIQEDIRKVGPLQNKEIVTRKMVPVKEEFTEGYMVYFPQGHSMFVAADDTDTLQRIGIGGPVPIVDMNTGEEVPQNVALTPKELVQRAQMNRPRPRSVGGLSEIMEGSLDG
jgi:hypothetical protein